MKNHAERAKELFGQGYNCAQAVFAAFCDETGMEQETALKLAAPFGGGVGRLREVCGSVSGMAMVLGMKYGYTDPKDTDTKMEHYQLVQSLVNEFKKKNGSLLCKELIGRDAEGHPYPNADTQPRALAEVCPGFVESAARILEDYIQSR